MTELLLKYIKGDCTESEKIKVVRWIDASPENMKEYLALRKLYDFTIWTSPDSLPKKEKSVWEDQPSKLRLVIFEIAKVAAVFALAFVLYKVILPGSGIDQALQATQMVHVPAGQRAEITLADSSKVWLNANTTLKFPSQFNRAQRIVEIDGEGFFEITTDKDRPFVVKSPQYDVRVWGTTFNLTAYSTKGNFETSLLEGKVEITRDGIEKGIFLKPNEQITLENKKLVIGEIRDYDRFLWREGVISFDNATFGELKEKLELYFDTKIQVNNKAVLNYRYTGKFRMDSGISHILSVLQFKSRFEFKINEDTNQIDID